MNSFARRAILALVCFTFTVNAQNIFVANDGSGTVSEFDPSGTLITNAFASGLSGPRGLAFDGSGNLYVANYYPGTVSKFNASGTLLTNAFVSGLNHPMDIAFDSAGNLYVANNGNNTVWKFDATGMLITNAFVKAVLNPYGLAFDGGGNLYVGNYGKVMKFNSSGTLVAGNFVSGSGQIWDVACDSSNNLYVANYGGNTVTKYDSSGNLLNTLTGLNGPTFIAISPPPPLKLVPMPWTVNGFQLTVPGYAGQTNVVETSTNLTDWNPCFTNIGSFVFTDTNGSHAGWRYYRTRHQ